MTDEQFDEICRRSLALTPGTASAATWSKIRPAKRTWLPTVPEILACGAACGLALLVFGARIGRHPDETARPNLVVQRAMRGSVVSLRTSDVQIPGTTEWTDVSFALPGGKP